MSLEESERQLQEKMRLKDKQEAEAKKKASPQLENGYTRIANELYEATMQYSLNGYELRVLHAIIRKTYGFGKKNDYIAFSQITELTKIKKTHVSRTVAALLSYNIVTKLGNNLGINKNISQWQVTKLGNKKKALNVLPKMVSELPKLVKPVTELGNEKLPKMALQKKKETITKETYTKERALYSKIEDLKEEDFQHISEKYQVPLAFVKSKLDDMQNWHDENPKKNNKANWKATLMNWVKRDAIKIRSSSANNKYSVTKV